MKDLRPYIRLCNMGRSGDEEKAVPGAAEAGGKKGPGAEVFKGWLGGKERETTLKLL